MAGDGLAASSAMTAASIRRFAGQASAIPEGMDIAVGASVKSCPCCSWDHCMISMALEPSTLARRRMAITGFGMDLTFCWSAIVAVVSVG